jgi:RNA recognition motif-containing protein
LGKRLYIGNLPFSATEDELRELFGRHGAIQTVNIVTDRETGRARGFAFVEFEEASGAEAAMRALDGSSLGGRTIRVNEALERGRGGPGGGGSRGGGGPRGGSRGGGGGGGFRDRDRY